MTTCSRVLTALAVLLYAMAARGADLGGVELKFSGFGTLGIVHSNEDQADFTVRYTKPTGAGYSAAWSGDVDTVIGAQWTATFSERLTAVVQVTSEQNPDSTYKPSLEWANLKYQVTPDFDIRAGRIVLPFLINSETRKVGFTRPWVRLPTEVYAVSPFSRSDGIDVSYRIRSGAWTHTVQVLAGRQDLRAVGPDKARLRDIRVLAYTGETGALTTRLVYQQAIVSVDGLVTMFDAYRQFGPQGIALADRFEGDGGRAAVVGAAASYDPGKWFALAEWGRQNTRMAFGPTSGWYVSAGYRVGNFTPYAMYAQARADHFSDPGLDITTLPSGLQDAAASLNANLNSILSQKNASDRISLGTRWDAFRGVDIKLQIDHIRGTQGSQAGLTNVQPGFRSGGSIDLISASIDAVF